jgi:hypothetical protein
MYLHDFIEYLSLRIIISLVYNWKYSWSEELWMRVGCGIDRNILLSLTD